MNKNWANKVRKTIALGLVAGTTMISTIIPVLGDGPQVQISEWSIGSLNEGEKYGIYPISWYEDGFLEAITEDKLNVLIKNVDRKLSELGLDKDLKFIPSSDHTDGTRGGVITALYNSLAKYELPDELEKDKTKAIEYVQKRGILNGTTAGLDLDKSCTVEQAVVFATKLIEDTYHATGAGAKGLMWEVENKGNKIYLLGSIHVGNTDLYPINKELKDAFEASDVLIVEANVLDPQGAEEFIELGMNPEGTSLQDYVSEETYAQCAELLELLGLPTDIYDPYKPWIVANELSVMMMTDSDSLEGGAEAGLYGVDSYFLTRGILAGKPIAELESMIYQAELFNNMPAQMQEQQLSEVLEEILRPDSEVVTESVDILNLWLDQWYAGDIDGFASSFLGEIEEEKTEFETMLFGKRDKDMADKLIDLLEKDEEATYFVVIGAGHLTEKNTVRDLLEAKGYVVERFWK